MGYEVLKDISPEKEILELERFAVKWNEKMRNATKDGRVRLMKARLIDGLAYNPDSYFTDKLAEILVEIWEEENGEAVTR